MADICTLLALTFINANACFAPPTCTMPDNGRVFCAQPAQMPCPQLPAVYHCRRPDGAVYTYTDNTATLPSAKK